jgi:hypothetical protein
VTQTDQAITVNPGQQEWPVSLQYAAMDKVKENYRGTLAA